MKLKCIQSKLPDGDVVETYQGKGVYIVATISQGQTVFWTAYFDRFSAGEFTFSGELRGMAPIDEWRKTINVYCRH